MSSPTGHSSASKCQICTINQFKYTCPRCSTRTCSLPCCRQHKQDTGCTGQRDKTKFLKKEEFTELDLLSDYKFLEESSNLIDAAQRQAAILGGSFFVNLSFYRLQFNQKLKNKNRYKPGAQLNNLHWIFRQPAQVCPDRIRHDPESDANAGHPTPGEQDTL